MFMYYCTEKSVESVPRLQHGLKTIYLEIIIEFFIESVMVVVIRR